MHEVRWPEFAESLETVGSYLDDRIRFIFIESSSVSIDVHVLSFT